MNNKAIKFIKNLFYIMSSNFISLTTATIVVLIVPNLIGIQEYAYWQLYMFYTSYILFFQFGWAEGIYLRYGGKKYNDLDKKLFFSQFYSLIILQVIIAIAIFTISIIFVADINMLFIFRMLAISTIISNSRSILIFILQTTNRMKNFAQVMMLEKISYITIIILFLFITREHRLLIIADLLARSLSLLVAVYFCKDIVIHKLSEFHFDFQEIILNICTGIKLVFHYLSSILIIGIVKFGVERSWDVTTFGRVSLTLSISNILMTFISAIGTVLYPILRQSNKDNLPIIYITIRNILIPIFLIIILLYYPAKEVLTVLLPDFEHSLHYMSLLFPIIVFQGKVSLLTNTYLNTLRRENLLLVINFIVVGLSIIFTVINTLLIRNLDLTVLSIIILLAIKSILSEIAVSKILLIPVIKDIILELILVAIFISVAWFSSYIIGIPIYVIAYMLYLLLKRKDIIKSIKCAKNIMKN